MYGNTIQDATGRRAGLPRGPGRRAGVLGAGWLMLLVLCLPPAAGALTIDLGTAAGQVGDTVLLPVELSDLGASSVYSCELAVSWSAAYASFVNYSSVGTSTAGWMGVFNSAPGSARITLAGIAPLAGDGTLVYLQFQLGPSAGTITLSLTEAILNEGDPEAIRVNGQLQITALPSLNISPDSGVLVVGETLTFATSGGTAPYTYTSSVPAVAGFGGGDVLTAYSPGFVQVTSEDDVGLTDTTTGSIEVRPFRLQVLASAGIEGEIVDVPIRIEDPAGYDIVAGEFEVTWYTGYADFVGVETIGTLMEAAGWSAPQVLATANSVLVAAAGSQPLPGPGILVYLRFLVHSTGPMTPTPGIFNEDYQAVPQSGTLTVTQLPDLYISPATANLLYGDTQTFTVGGGPTPPLTWSVDDPALAVIDETGELFARGEGIVQVRAEDALGAVAYSGAISICSVGLPALAASIGADEVVMVPVQVDRWLTGMGIYSLEIEVDYDPNSVQYLATVTAGTRTSDWGMATVNDRGSRISVYHAGQFPLEECGPALFYLMFRGDPGLSYPYTGLRLAGALFNEGTPCALIDRGSACSAGSDAPVPAATGLLLQNHPNPFNPRTTIRFRTESDGPARLAVYSARGERVCVLLDGFVRGGIEHDVIWNGRDERGRGQASGVYHCRLESAGANKMSKMVLLR